jgi:hypothetical protein
MAPFESGPGILVGAGVGVDVDVGRVVGVGEGGAGVGEAGLVAVDTGAVVAGAATAVAPLGAAVVGVAAACGLEPPHAELRARSKRPKRRMSEVNRERDTVFPPVSLLWSDK